MQCHSLSNRGQCNAIIQSSPPRRKKRSVGHKKRKNTLSEVYLISLHIGSSLYLIIAKIDTVILCFLPETQTHSGAPSFFLSLMFLLLFSLRLHSVLWFGGILLARVNTGLDVNDQPYIVHMLLVNDTVTSHTAHTDVSLYPSSCWLVGLC